jgi:myo-inositol-1(or 4)-monophosphatase
MSRTEWESGLDRRVTTLPVRPLSSAAYKLARVAAGLDDGTFSIWPRREWDVCAGVALIRAAGGIATLLDGSAIGFNRRDVRLSGGLVAAGPLLHGPLQLALARLALGA